MDKTIERKEPDGTWQAIKFEDLKQGDCIRDKEYPDRTLIVETEPTYNQQAGCLGIKVSPYICDEQEIAMKEANDLLRSAYQIATRKGESTNWEAFKNNVEKELLKQAGVPNTTDQQTILRTTCTPLTYRIVGTE